MSQGQESKQILNKILRDLLLNDAKARNVTRRWGKVTASDQYIYDNTQFKMKVQADADEDKVLAISKNFNDLTIKVTNNGNAEIFDGGKKFKVSKGTEATIEIYKSSSCPTVQYSGTLDIDPKE